MIDHVGRPKSNDYPPYMTPDGDRGGFIVRNPISGKKKRFTAAEEALARETARLVGELVETERAAKAFDEGRPTIRSLVDAWKRDRLPFMPWDKGTRKAHVWKMDRFVREHGDRLVARTDCMFLEEWLTSFCHTADQWNKWRYVLTLLWRYAVSRKQAEVNEAEKIEPRSTSKKLEINRKVRQQLDVPGFAAIHAKSPCFLQLAMELSLITLQARQEVCNMQHPHFRNGYLFVIRDKVSADSDMAFIKIVVTEQLEEIRCRALRLDGIASPYLVHRAPERRRREWIQNKAHWTYVNPDYLTKTFAAVRDATGLYDHLDPRQRPTFHEIRGLGARLYEAQGMPQSAIQALMTHAHKRTTEIYLEKGIQALTDDDYQRVVAPLRLADVLG
jgi:integrase